MTDHMTMIVFLLSQFVCHLLYFLIFPVPVIFKKIVLHPGVRGRYLCPQPKFQNPGWPVIWYSGSFEGGQYYCAIQNHLAGRKECLGTRQMREFTLAKIIWLSIYRRSFGCHMITPPSLPLSTSRETKMKCHFLASVGACNMILLIHVMLWAVDSCQNRVSADQYHMAQL